MKDNGLRIGLEEIGKAIVVVGLAAISAWLGVNGAGVEAKFWGTLAVLVLFFA